MSKIKILGIEANRSLTYLHSYHIHYQSKLGNPRVWEFVSRAGIERLQNEIYEHRSYSDGATIFACNRARTHVALIREFRIPTGRYLYALPAGLKDDGESIESAAIREFKEETGLALDIVAIERERYTSVGLSNEKVNIVYGYYSGTPSDEHLEESEDISVQIVDRSQVLDILAHREVPIRTALLLKAFYGLTPLYADDCGQ